MASASGTRQGDKDSEREKRMDAYVAGVRRHMDGFHSLFDGLPLGIFTGVPSDYMHRPREIDPYEKEQLSRFMDAFTRQNAINSGIADLIYEGHDLTPPPIYIPVTRIEIDLIIERLLCDSNIIVRKSDPDYLRYFAVKVKGCFECPECTTEWISHNAWLKFDLLERDVKKYKRACLNLDCCNWADLYFKKEEFEVIAKKVMVYYKKRKKAGGIVPSFENEGLDKGRAIKRHEEELCQRCRELHEPCWLYLVPIAKPMPFIRPDFIQNSLGPPLKKLHASIKMGKDDENKNIIRVLPLKESTKIKNWRQRCENMVDSFLKSYSDLTVPVQPDLVPKLQGVMETAKSKPSICLERQTVLQVVAAAKQDVDELLEKIKAIDVNTQYDSSNNSGSCKPCIILF